MAVVQRSSTKHAVVKSAIAEVAVEVVVVVVVGVGVGVAEAEAEVEAVVVVKRSAVLCARTSVRNGSADSLHSSEPIRD